ncbi:hypothetical protein J0X14_12280 [Muricauda sp. CAU 1633]|uniref:hypothetical protein n=1 Tax=Allomuricauda sp. CAU 1633 TaxID=2816036 RepID=UPI001A8DAC71|nr:hypothetical protein [Muricauda sp. CAU 1633]MBO0323076.1 hypothetical protein [Muricauda sp. CAU 1633]
MKNSYILAVFLLCITQNVLFGQSNAPLLQSIPQESVYVHFNESTLFTGEKLLYKFYGLDNATKKLTAISTVGYVSLVDKNGEAVFSHKLRLDSGSSSGDFFLPVSLSTGPYKLVGYTQWMQNFGQESFFQADVYIINPYQAIPEAYLEKAVDSLQKTPLENENRNSVEQSTDSPFVNVLLDKGAVGKREKVVIAIEGANDSSLEGNFSISVKKKSAVSFGNTLSSVAFLQNLNRNGGKTGMGTTKDLHIPEIRGEVISGTILDKESKVPTENQRIVLSLPGDAFLFKVATSDSEGRFSFILDRKYDNSEAALQLLTGDMDQYEINLDPKLEEYDNLTFPEFVIPQVLENSILQRSVHNQIENAYGEVRSDSVIRAEDTAPFYRNLPIVYDLDAYTRFNTLAETIIEVTDHLSIKTLNDGNRIFEVRPSFGLPNDNLSAAVFVDGLFLKKHEDFMGYSAKKIKSISFSRDDVMIGSQAFQGILHFKTLEGDFHQDFYAPDIKNIELFKPELQKKYFNQEYAEQGGQARTPDFRHQLLWIPNLNLSEGKQELIFYTSDVAGTYELVLEGFTSNGNPVSVKRELVVE